MADHRSALPRGVAARPWSSSAIDTQRGGYTKAPVHKK
jgi:hypothetical protein